MSVEINLPSGARVTKSRIEESLGGEVVLKKDLQDELEEVLEEVGVTEVKVGDGDPEKGSVTVTKEKLGLGKVENKSASDVLSELSASAVETLLNENYNGSTVKGVSDRIADNASKIASLQEAVGQDEDGNSLSERVSALESGKLDANLAKVEAVLGNTGHATGGDSTYKIATDAKSAASTNAADISELAGVVGDYEGYSDDDILTRLDEVEDTVDGLDSVYVKTEQLNQTKIEQLINGSYDGSNGVNKRLTDVEGKAAANESALEDKIELSDIDSDLIEGIIASDYKTAGKVDARLKAIDAKADANASALEDKIELEDITSELVESIIASDYQTAGKVDARIKNLVAKDTAQDEEIAKKLPTANFTQAKIEETLGLDWEDDADEASSLAEKIAAIDEKIADTSALDDLKEELEDAIDDKLDASAFTKEAIVTKLGFTPESADKDVYKNVTVLMSKWVDDESGFKRYDITASELELSAFPKDDSEGDITVVANPLMTVVQADAASDAGFIKGSNTATTLSLFALAKPVADLPLLLKIDFR